MCQELTSVGEMTATRQNNCSPDGSDWAEGRNKAVDAVRPDPISSCCGISRLAIAFLPPWRRAPLAAPISSTVGTGTLLWEGRMGTILAQ
jgi:hypothetical protein